MNGAPCTRVLAPALGVGLAVAPAVLSIASRVSAAEPQCLQYVPHVVSLQD